MLWVLALPGALVVGFSMGLFGSGGSILTVPILVYLLGWDEKIAIASSLAIVGLVALITSLRNLREGTIDWAAVLWFGLPESWGLMSVPMSHSSLPVGCKWQCLP